jgi:hypothetical protein
MPGEQWRGEFVLARESVEVGARSELYRRTGRGELVVVARGAYHRRNVDRDSADDRYLARVRATRLSLDRSIVFSHASAAVCWGLPTINDWPTAIHAIAPVDDGGRSIAGLTVHCVGIPPDVVRLAGLTLTSLPRTIADIGSTLRLEDAVSMADAALAGMSDTDSRVLRAPMDLASLEREVAARGSARGIRQLRWLAGFADGRSGSAGESLSRLAMHRMKCPPPILQQEFRDARGLIGYVDFWWPEFNLIGEFDGRGKYLRQEFTRGRTVAEVVIAEKLREDRLRASRTHPGVLRWGWATARSVPLLAARLRAAGLPV